MPKNKVLVVDDSRAINEMVSYKIANELHMDVESAKSMQEAIGIIENQEDAFFVAILDLNLPDAGKGEIVDYVLSKKIPPIVLTGNLSDQLHDEMMKKPIVDYVVKRNLNEIDYVVQTVKRLYDNMSRKVLVVDDSKYSRSLINALLSRHYLTVVEASNGEEALGILDQQNDFILIVVDYHMPIMDGAEFNAKVREVYSRNDMAIIGISAMESGATAVKLLKSGANDFIASPFLHEEFYCRINQNIDAVANYRKLKYAAERDFLTGLFNRKYLFDTGEKLYQNAARENITLMVAVVDIDHFKKINDTYGHHIGDQAIKHVANILTGRVRGTDIVARMGGEEFCLLCVNINRQNSEKLLEYCRNMVCEDAVDIDGESISMSISIGFTLKLKDSLDQIINDADGALYAAKNRGRNCIVCSSEHVED